MSREISLDSISLAPAAIAAWGEICRREAGKLQGIKPSEIPDERVRENDDGTLTIYVTLPDGGEISMVVPAEHWAGGTLN